MAASLAVQIVISAAQATITPGDGQSIVALGHTWTFATIQTSFLGFDVLMDGKATSWNGIQLSWNGSTLMLTWHGPYDFDPGTGKPQNPPLHTETIIPP